MKLIKLFGVSVIAIGLTACGGADNGAKEEKAAEAAPAVEAPAAEKAMEQATTAVEEVKEAVVEAVEEVKEAAPEPKTLRYRGAPSRCDNPCAPQASPDDLDVEAIGGRQHLKRKRGPKAPFQFVDLSGLGDGRLCRATAAG